MPSGQTEFSQRGEINEQFASLIIGELAFVTRVSRPMDVGHDLICVLKEIDERYPNYINAGPSFTVQVKSNYDNIRFSNEREVQWLTDQETPFFVCVVDRENFSINLYSTWNIHNSYLYCNPEKLTLKLDEEIDPIKPTYPREKPDCQEKQFVPLGRPILKIALSDIWDSEQITHYRNVLRLWVLLEQENIVNIRAKMHWVVGHTIYETNSPPPQDINLFIYFNFGVNFQYYVRNLGRVVTLLRSAFHHRFEGLEYEVFENPQTVEALDEIQLAYWDYFDPQIRNLLEGLEASQNQMRKKCKGITKKGARCKKVPLIGHSYCKDHIPRDT